MPEYIGQEEFDKMYLQMYPLYRFTHRCMNCGKEEDVVVRKKHHFPGLEYITTQGEVYFHECAPGVMGAMYLVKYEKAEES